MASSIISIDWLQLYVDLTLLEYSGEFEVKKLDYGTKHFEILEEIYLQGSIFASIQRKPRSEIIKEHTGIIKIENSILYFADSELIINNFLSLCKIHVLNITRLDIAVDFKKFKNGLLPQNLIKGFMKEKYLKNGRGKYTLIGEQKNVLDVSYLRFGTRASDVNVILYNKSLEMKQKVHKQYISDTWKQLSGSPLADVWRIEFSLKSKANTFVNQSTGEVQNIDLSILSDSIQKQSIASALEDRYFEFKINDGKTNKTRMKRLALLDFDSVEFTNRYMPSGSDIYKRDKSFMKRLYVLDKEQRNVPEYIIEAKNDILEYMQNTEFMEDYFMRKKADWDKTVFRS